MYIKRFLEEEIIKNSKIYPVIMVCGQRQVGKSTMLHHLMEPEWKYVTLDDQYARRLAENDAALFFEIYDAPLLIDEFQRLPSILLEMKRIVDEKMLNGEDCKSIRTSVFWKSWNWKSSWESVFAWRMKWYHTIVRCGIILCRRYNELLKVRFNEYGSHHSKLNQKTNSIFFKLELWNGKQTSSLAQKPTFDCFPSTDFNEIPPFDIISDVSWHVECVVLLTRKSW